MDVKDESSALGERCCCCYAEPDICNDQNDENLFGSHLLEALALLKETFNVELSHTTSKHVCQACEVRLRDASDFKRLVQETENKFMSLHVEESELKEKDVKVEMDDSLGIERKWDADILDPEYYGEDPMMKLIVKVEPSHSDAQSGSPRASEPVDAPEEATMKSDVKLWNSINTIETLTDQPLSTTRSAVGVAKSSVTSLGTNDRLTGELLNASESSELMSKLLVPLVRIDALDEETITEALGGKKSLLKPVKMKKTKLNRPASEDLAHDMARFDRHTERQIVKRNVMALLRTTNVCPFISFRDKFRCFYCTETFFSFDPLQAHVAEAHTNIKKLVRKINTSQDIVHLDITDLMCRRCKKPFADIDTIKEHLVEEHKVKINKKHKDDVIQFRLKGVDGYKCHLCAEEFHVFRNLSLHMNNHFQNYMCNVCGKSFISHRRCQAHERSHETGSFACSKCDKVFPSHSTRNQHTLKHRVSKYRCPQCPARFNKYFERTVHMSLVHNFTQTFRCTHPGCSKEFIHKPQLSSHMRVHEPKGKKAECPVCHMRFFNNYALATHMVTHTGERPFQCKVCGKRYGRKNTLREHMRIHENDRRHVCNECGQSFIQKCSLVGHMKSRHPQVFAV